MSENNFITSLYLSDRAAFERLQAVAVAAGCFQTRGPGAGSLGSVGALNQALADGAVVAVRAPVLAQVLDLLNKAYADMMPHEPGRAEVIAALRLLGHDPEPETHYTPPSVVDAVAGSGAYLAHVTAPIIGNPPAGEEEDAA